MLEVIQRFGKKCICHLQGDCALAWSIGKPCAYRAVEGEWDITDPTGGPEDRASQLRHSTLASYSLSYIRLPKTLNQYIFTVKMAMEITAETCKLSIRRGPSQKAEALH
jgi:hypothetical protein